MNYYHCQLRSKKVLVSEGIETLSQLKKEFLSGGLKDLKGIGEKYLNEIEDVLKSYSEEAEEESILNRSIEEVATELSISMDDLNILKLGGVKTLKDLTKLSPQDLLSEKFNLSSKVVKKIENRLKKWNLSLRKEISDEA